MSLEFLQPTMYLFLFHKTHKGRTTANLFFRLVDHTDWHQRTRKDPVCPLPSSQVFCLQPRDAARYNQHSLNPSCLL